MRQLFLEKGAIAVQEACQPVLDEYSVLVSVHYSFISSGTESATLANAAQNPLLTNIPQKVAQVLKSLATNGLMGTRALVEGRLKGTVQSLGYSCAGKVIATGSKVETVRVGDLVACAGAGMANHADVVCVPENLVALVGDEAYLKDASITTIGAIALQGIRRTDPKLGEYVCVLGLGLIGQITVQLAKLSGCIVIGVDLVPERLELAKKLGADYVFNGLDEAAQKELKFLTAHQGVDSTIITAASKSDALVQQSMEITRKKGKVIVVGDVGLGLQRSPFYAKEIDFLISCSYGPGRYDHAYERQGKDYPYAYVRWTENRNMRSFVELIEKGKIDIASLISQEVSIDRAEDAYASISTQAGLGFVVSYLPKETETYQPSAQPTAAASAQGLTFVPAKRGSLRVGVVGAGGFCKMMLMPIISKFDNVQIKAIVDADNANAINVSRLYVGATPLSHPEDLFKEDLVDVALVASPHKYHFEHIMKALAQGKAVFAEKPMVTERSQHEELSAFLKQHPDIPFCVDYNRSFAPFMQKIKTEVVKRHAPLVAHYRMNAGFIPKDHWVQTEVGAGRLIGEACHIFDLFCFLTDAKPVALSVETLRPISSNLCRTDNFSVQISFSDGSLCSLLYTAVGGTALGKERLELFFDGKSIVMDDYKTLEGYGLSASFNEKVLAPDKGHTTLLKAFFDYAKEGKGQTPMSIERLETVSNLTLLINDLALQGGGTQEL